MNNFMCLFSCMRINQPRVSTRRFLPFFHILRGRVERAITPRALWELPLKQPKDGQLRTTCCWVEIHNRANAYIGVAKFGEDSTIEGACFPGYCGTVPQLTRHQRKCPRQCFVPRSESAITQLFPLHTAFIAFPYLPGFFPRGHWPCTSKEARNVGLSCTPSVISFLLRNNEAWRVCRIVI